MDSDEYQARADAFATQGGKTLIYALLGMAEELGELADKIDFTKMRDVTAMTNQERLAGGDVLCDGDITVAGVLAAIRIVGDAAGVAAKCIRKEWDRFTAREKAVLTEHTVAPGADKECGDLEWMLAALEFRLGLHKGTIMEQNLDKLASRKAKGLIVGSGDTDEERLVNSKA